MCKVNLTYASIPVLTRVSTSSEEARSRRSIYMNVANAVIGRRLPYTPHFRRRTSSSSRKVLAQKRGCRGSTESLGFSEGECDKADLNYPSRRTQSGKFNRYQLQRYLFSIFY